MKLIFFAIIGVILLITYFYLIFIKGDKIRKSKYWYLGWLGSIFILALSHGFLKPLLNESPDINPIFLLLVLFILAIIVATYQLVYIWLQIKIKTKQNE